MSFAFRSGIFISAISRTASRLIFPTLLRFGSPDPLSTLAAFNSSLAAGGVLVMKLNERSSKTVISTGMTLPVWAWVLSL